MGLDVVGFKGLGVVVCSRVYFILVFGVLVTFRSFGLCLCFGSGERYFFILVFVLFFYVFGVVFGGAEGFRVIY